VEILVLHPGALGDIILSLPAILLLRERFPAAKISFAGDTDKIWVAAHGYADRLISLSSLPLHRLHSRGPLSEADAQFWNSFDRILSWTGSGSTEVAQKFENLKSEVCCARWRPDAGETRHVSRIFADSLHPWLPPQADLPQARIILTDKNREDAGEWLAEKGWRGEVLVALNPGAGGLAKRWALESFRSLALLIFTHSDSGVLIIEGPAERGLAVQLSAELPIMRTYVAESLPLPVLAGVLTHCSVYAGNDSGVAHLSAGLGIPTVVIFGPTIPQQWAPLGSHVSALRRNQGCAACNIGSENEHICLQNISPADVWREIHQLANNSR
jgi:ADP-heptose:LPS heptosyltransferase